MHLLSLEDKTFINREINFLREIEPALSRSEIKKLNNRKSTYFPLSNASSASLDAFVEQIVNERYIHLIFFDGYNDLGGAQLFSKSLIRAFESVSPDMTTVQVDFAKSRMIVAEREIEIDHFSNLSFEDKVRLSYVLCTLDKVKSVVIGNSEAGMECIGRYGKLISQKKPSAVMLFCGDKDIFGREISFGKRHFKNINFKEITIFSDNQGYVSDLAKQETTSLDATVQVITVIPTTFEVRNPKTTANRSTVAWSARVTRQKQPHLISKIARRLPDVDFLVFGKLEGLIGWRVRISLARARNVYYQGTFTSFSEVVAKNPSIFLHTSLWDGRPNTVIEAGANGIPVVASDVGYIYELLGMDSERGTLVNKINRTKSYVDAIRFVLLESHVAQGRAEKFRAWIHETYTESVNQNIVREFLGLKTD